MRDTSMKYIFDPQGTFMVTIGQFSWTSVKICNDQSSETSDNYTARKTELSFFLQMHQFFFRPNLTSKQTINYTYWHLQ